MKPALICLSFLFCLTIIVFSNCKKDDSFKTAVDLETLAYLPDSLLCTATKEVPGLGAITWKANCLSALKDSKIILTFITYDNLLELNIREVLGIQRIPKKIGNYTIEPFEKGFVFSGYETRLADGDVVNAGWDINTLKKNYIEITAIDTTTGVFEGKFDIYFKMTNQGIESNTHSEYINFKNGNFRAKYSK
jgi:hypothetical protein